MALRFSLGTQEGAPPGTTRTLVDSHDLSGSFFASRSEEFDCDSVEPLVQE